MTGGKKLGQPVPLCSSEGKAYLRLPAAVPFERYAEAWFAAFDAAGRADFEAAAARRLGPEEAARELLAREAVLRLLPHPPFELGVGSQAPQTLWPTSDD